MFNYLSYLQYVKKIKGLKFFFQLIKNIDIFIAEPSTIRCRLTCCWHNEARNIISRGKKCVDPREMQLYTEIW
jgi:hypothetical protein